MTDELKRRIDRALEFAMWALTEGNHHRMYVIDQMVRELTGDGYKEWVSFVKAGADGPNTYHWDEGRTP